MQMGTMQSCFYGRVSIFVCSFLFYCLFLLFYVCFFYSIVCFFYSMVYLFYFRVCFYSMGIIRNLHADGNHAKLFLWPGEDEQGEGGRGGCRAQHSQRCGVGAPDFV